MPLGPGSVTDMLGALGKLVSLSGPRFCVSEMRGLAQKLSEMVLLRVWSVEEYHLRICQKFRFPGVAPAFFAQKPGVGPPPVF